MKRKIIVFASAFLMVFTLVSYSNTSEAAVCHKDDQGVCCLAGYGQWSCYCLPVDTK
ncbi:MAG: hypothetical protein KAI79_01575 [Bacteroidales bacterium]|nr:hypothetical protein [Bacteroidales bacterium]